MFNVCMYIYYVHSMIKLYLGLYYAFYRSGHIRIMGGVCIILALRSHTRSTHTRKHTYLVYFCDVRTRNPRRIFDASDVKANVYSLVCCLTCTCTVLQVRHNAQCRRYGNQEISESGSICVYMYNVSCSSLL